VRDCIGKFPWTISPRTFSPYPARLRLERKGKEEYLYSAFYILCISQSAQAWITQFYLRIHHACLSFVSVHQMSPPLTEVRDIQLQLTRSGVSRVRVRFMVWVRGNFREGKCPGDNVRQTDTQCISMFMLYRQNRTHSGSLVNIVRLRVELLTIV